MNSLYLHFICLMPIWNHRHETICNAIQCFVDQTWEHKTLIMIDDRPPQAKWHTKEFFSGLYADCYFESANADELTVALLNSNIKYPTLPSKYNAGLLKAPKFDNGCLVDDSIIEHVAIWDDDDGFSPRHLELAAEAYANNPQAHWTHPKEVFSTYGGKLHTEDATGRFWSSITFRRSCLDPWDGLFPIRKAIGQDQLFLRELQDRYGDPARPTIPSYVYRWGEEGENHSTGHAVGGFYCEEWWDTCPCSTSSEPFIPKYDEFYLRTLEEMREGWPTSIAP